MKKLLLALVTLPTFLFAQDITNTLGTGGKLEVKTSAGTPVEVLTVTDGSQVIISDVASPTAKTDVILDLNSTTKTLQLPMIDPSIWILGTHGPGRIFWNTGGDGNLEVFYGPGITDFATVLNSRDGIRFLSDVQGNDNSTSIYIGLDAATDGNGGNGPNNGDQENVAFGHNALFNLGSPGGAGILATENTAIGAYAGYDVTTGRGNTALGYQSGLPIGNGTLNYTTAIGYGAKAEVDNQIMLGRTVDAVVIPGKTELRGAVTYAYAAGGATTLTDEDYVYVCDEDNKIVTLPDPTGIEGRVYIIKYLGTISSNCTITCGNAFIDGSTNQVIGPNEYLTVVSGGAGHWYIIGK